MIGVVSTTAQYRPSCYRSSSNTDYHPIPSFAWLKNSLTALFPQRSADRSLTWAVLVGPVGHQRWGVGAGWCPIERNSGRLILSFMVADIWSTYWLNTNFACFNIYKICTLLHLFLLQKNSKDNLEAIENQWSSPKIILMSLVKFDLILPKLYRDFGKNWLGFGPIGTDDCN